VGSADDPLGMQLLVHQLRRRRIDAEALSPGCAVGVVAVAAAFGAWAMSGGEGDRFIVEIEECVVMWLPLLMPAAAKLERAGDPEIACVEADDLVAAVKDAAVARPRTSKRDRLDLTHWCNAITGRHHIVRQTT
jgi:hypothetical protein